MRAGALVWFIVGFAFSIFWMNDGLGALFTGVVGIVGAFVADRAWSTRTTYRQEKSAG